MEEVRREASYGRRSGMLRRISGIVSALGFLAGCAAGPLAGFDGGEAPLLQPATEAHHAPGTAGRLCGIYLGEPRGAVDVGLQIVYPGKKDALEDNPTSPRYDQIWDRSLGLAASMRGAIGMATDFQYYFGGTFAMMKGKDYFYAGAPVNGNISLSDETVITVTGGVQYRKDLKKMAPYGRMGVGLLFWPATELQTDVGDIDGYDSSSKFVFELGGGMAFNVGMGRLYFDIGYIFGPAPDVASDVEAQGLGTEAGRYDTFTMTFGGALRL